MYGKGIILSPALLYQPKKKISLSAYGGRGTNAICESIIYTNLLTSGKLNSYLADIDEQAEEMFFRLVEQMAEREGVTEQFKAANGLEWTRRMNNIRACAMELVNTEIIYN